MQREITIPCEWLPGVSVTFNMMASQPEIEKFLETGAREGLSVIKRVEGWKAEDGPSTGPEAPWGFRYWCASEAGFTKAMQEFTSDPNSPTV